MVLAVIASLTDVIETGILLSLTEELMDGGTKLPGLVFLWVPVTMKFAALEAMVLSSGFYIVTRSGIVWNAFGAPVMLAYAATRTVRGPTPPLELTG